VRVHLCLADGRPSDPDATVSGIASPSDNSANGAPGLHREVVDRRAPVGSSSTRPGATSDTTLDKLALESILDQLVDDAARYLYEAGFDSHRVEVGLHVEYAP
jgi:hypothetical protein